MVKVRFDNYVTSQFAFVRRYPECFGHYQQEDMRHLEVELIHHMFLVDALGRELRLKHKLSKIQSYISDLTDIQHPLRERGTTVKATMNGEHFNGKTLYSAIQTYMMHVVNICAKAEKDMSISCENSQDASRVEMLMIENGHALMDARYIWIDV